MVRTCIVCRVTTNTDNIAFHLFPKNEEKRAKWCHALGIAMAKPYQAVCGNHFNPNDYIFSQRRKILKSFAVPSVSVESITDLSMSNVSTSKTIRHSVKSIPDPTISPIVSTPKTMHYSVENIPDSSISPIASTSKTMDQHTVNLECLDCSTPKRKRKNLFYEHSSNMCIQERMYNPSRFVDLKSFHFMTPRQASIHLEFVKNTVKNLRRKNKLLHQKNKRLEKKVSTLNDMLSVLKEKSLMTDLIN